MVTETVPLARVPLARSIPRMLAVPSVALLVGLAAIAGGAWLGGWAGIGLAALGVLVVALSIALAVRLLTLRLEVDVGAIRLRWTGGSRDYLLARGPVTRVRVLGEAASPLRPRLGFLGWSLGSARLRDDERIRLIRLAPTETLILVPIEGGRLGISAANEQDLVAALSAAARVQQRLDDVAARGRRFVLAAQPSVPATVPPSATPAAGAADWPEDDWAPPIPGARPPAVETPPPVERPLPPQPTALREPEPRFLTGIERVMLEERLAAERAAALAAAEAERMAAERAAAERATVEPAPRLAGRDAARPGGGLRRRPSLPRPRLGLARAVSWRVAGLGALVALPALAATVLWAIAVVTGRTDGETARLLILALVLAGPAGTLGALFARLWWPRLAPLVSSSALLALVLIGRGIIS